MVENNSSMVAESLRANTPLQHSGQVNINQGDLVSMSNILKVSYDVTNKYPFLDENQW